VPGAGVSAPSPALGVADALLRIADAATIVALCGRDGEAILAWGDALAAVPWRAGAELGAWIDGLVPAAPAVGPIPAREGWAGFDGGCLLALDYEAPARPPRAWRARAWASWSGGGPAFHGEPQCVERLREDLARPPAGIAPPRLLGPLAPSLSQAAHARAVGVIQDYIAQGDIYQANLTMSRRGRLAPAPHRDLACARALLAASPAPYAAVVRSPGQPTVVSHSPECFLRARGRAVRSSPIKGTRGRVHGEEEARRRELLASAKDRAELAMIVDLVRNDLGRVAVPGSVLVTSPVRLLDLDYAHHLVADVDARLGENLGYGALIASAFPAGSITGAPKLRAIAILAGLEQASRGAYCGTFGWIGPRGLELAVAIRTVLVDDDQVRLCAGGGIVADSDPAAEWEEACAKSAGMVRALGGAMDDDPAR
jgi:para-aminobenzoate synthetase component 1